MTHRNVARALLAPALILGAGACFATRTDLAVVASDVQAIRGEVQATRAQMLAGDSALHRSLDTALAARTTLVAAIDQRVMALFERVGKQRKGVAICQATRDGLCSVCHVRLRPPVFQQVRMNTAVVQCESCQRILYYIPPPAPIEPPVVHTP